MAAVAFDLRHGPLDESFAESFSTTARGDADRLDCPPAASKDQVRDQVQLQRPKHLPVLDENDDPGVGIILDHSEGVR